MRIFAIDDEEAILKRLEKCIRSKRPNDEIVCFDDPTKALAYAKENVPDVVFTDIEMPKMTGIALAKKLKDLNRLTKIVFCTAYSDYAVKAFELHANGYLLKPYDEDDINREIENIFLPNYLPYQKRIFIQTFGNFDVFYENKIIDFSRNKSKEILAYLVSKKGSEVDIEEIASVIWEDDAYDNKLKKQLYVYISDLKSDLEQYGISDIVVKTKMGYAIDRQKVDCDYYRLLDGDLAIINKYEGEFMAQYSWAEYINAYLENNF